MKVKELIERLKTYPEDIEVRIMNVAIDEDESCPTFEIDAVESALDIHHEMELITCKEDDCVLIEFKDDLHLNDMYKFNYKPFQNDIIDTFNEKHKLD